jgi:hypothetical protein
VEASRSRGLPGTLLRNPSGSASGVKPTAVGVAGPGRKEPMRGDPSLAVRWMTAAAAGAAAAVVLLAVTLMRTMQGVSSSGGPEMENWRAERAMEPKLLLPARGTKARAAYMLVASPVVKLMPCQGVMQGAGNCRLQLDTFADLTCTCTTCGSDGT